MVSVACPKCSIVAQQTPSGGWRFDPPAGCVDLRGTEWGQKGEFEWCPTLAAAMPPEFFLPGQSHRDHVLRVAAQAQGTESEESKKEA
jgi:hypothetical protein